MKKYIYSISIILLFFILPVAKSEGASLYLSPASGEYSVSSSFSVAVKINSSNSAINVVDATISYPANLLEVKSISKSGSMLKLWTKEPVFSNSSGTISFSGGVTAPGFTGIGTGLVINFVAKKEGQAQVSFSSGAVLAADGKGTDVLAGFGNAKFNIKPGSSVAPAPVPSAKTPSAPMIYSSTHSDPNQWYNDSGPKFSWSMKRDITGVSFLINDKPSSSPGFISDGVISEKQFENIEDGVWYFHLRLKNSNGWGAISHFKFSIDTKTPTDFTMEFSSKEEMLEQGLKIKFLVNDDLSGINRFEVKVDNNETIIFSDNESRIYDLPILDPEKHSIAVKVFDNAENFIADFKELEIEALDPPEIKEYSSELKTGSFLVVKGSTYPNSDLTIWIQKDKEMTISYEIKSDDLGSFMFISDSKMEIGRYKLRTEAVNELGLKTSRSKEIFILVQESDLSKLKSTIQDLIVIISIFVTFILLLVLIIILVDRKIKTSRKKIKKEVHEAEDALEKAFNALYKDMVEQLESLEKISSKRELNKEEKEIRRKFKNNLKVAKKFIKKEIEDIEKEI